MTWLWYLLGALGLLLCALIAVLLVRTLRFSPRKEERVEAEPLSFDRSRAVESLASLLRFRTVSHRDPAEEEEAEFDALVDALAGLFPNVAAHCERTEFAGRALLFRWKGSEAGEPAVLMSHYDVVPVDEERWQHPPFAGEILDGVLWGRGALDTKVTFSGILFAADHLIGEGFVPAHDIYLAFSGSEEINGEGARNIVAYFQKHQLTPSIVLDEGGAVVQDVFPGVHRPSAMVGIAEKGMMDVRFSVKSSGGHASAPRPHTPVGELSALCSRIENHPFPCHLCTPTRKMFDTLARHSNFLYRMIFANLWCFSGLLDLLCRKTGGELNALLRTTVAFTQMEGSNASNVIPTRATMVANIRLNPEDRIEGTLDYLRNCGNNERVEICALHGTEPSRVSTTACEGWEKLTRAIGMTWEDVIVTPYLMMQCSDSRHWGVLSDRVYRFSAMDLTAQERATIHGNDERIRLDCVHRSVEFFIRLMRQL